MLEFFTVDALVSLITLTVLEVVLGIDNVIFVSILMGRLDEKQKLKARKIWMLAGIVVRSILLFGLGWLVTNGSKEIFSIFGYGFNLRNCIMLVGGLFLLYKTVKEIHDKLEGEDVDEKSIKSKSSVNFAAVMGQIVLIDMVFSFDSIITAIGLANKVPIMIIAVIIAMIIMFFFAQKISYFIHKHPALKILALSFLLMVGFSLFFEGLEPIHHKEIPKGYIYVSMAFAFGVEMINMLISKKSKSKPVELKEPELEEMDNDISDNAK
jgi:predicted tellurium resistance membrane protein TerC